MLTRLTIQNYALIRHLEMTPSEKLTVITGETGAGKSIMLGAIALLLGNRADTKVLWDESAKCITEGQFDIARYGLENLFEDHDLDYSEMTVFRREISVGGKSRAFINDTPVTLDVMSAIGSRLMDVHSQHETLELGTHRFQLALVDSYAGNAALQSEYNAAWKTFQQAHTAHATLATEAERLRAESDYVRFQLTELEKSGFQPGEQEQLESDLKVAEHAEDIKSRLSQIIALLGDSEAAAQSQLSQASSLLQPIREISPVLQQLAGRLDALRIEIKDLLREMEREEQHIDVDPARSRGWQERLDVLYGLLQKHRLQDINALMLFQDRLSGQVRKTINLDDDLAKARRELDAATTKARTKATALTASRKKVIDPLCKELAGLLKPLGIPQATLTIECSSTEPGPTGADQVEILFSANKGIPPKPLEAVASGGEFSRLMFCVKYVLAEKSALPTLVLDEIDTGVSGEIAIQLGIMMQRMARTHQLITISHLPQIAAKGDAHYLVFKDTTNRKTFTEIRPLGDEERIEEIAKMIGGAKPSSVARENARELLRA